jgi:phosphoenolpyruvate carboxylase
LIPAWYGLGAALGGPVATSDESLDDLRRMYRDWPFFRATIDNAVLALAKSNLPVFHRYCDLAGDDPGCGEVEGLIKSEWRLADKALRAITDCNELLDNVAWLKRSIVFRNGYVDPLNLIQVELQLRSRDAGKGDSAEELAHLRQLTVKGVAAGMRTTG